jgi:hypothetical protein
MGEKLCNTRIIEMYWEAEVKLYLCLKLADRCKPEGVSSDLWIASYIVSRVECRKELLRLLGIESWLYGQAARSLVTILTELFLHQTNNIQ